MLRQLRRVAVAFVGGTVVAVGVAMVVLPGPAILVIPAGLAILATEFHWAGRLLHRVRRTTDRGLAVFKRRAPADAAAKARPPDVPHLRAS